MKRRDFLRVAAQTSTAAVLPLMLGGFSLQAFARNPFLHAMVPESGGSDRVLVLVQLIGGNDGLQTMIPLDQYSKLAKARPLGAIPENELLGITPTNAFHPNLGGMQNLFKDGKLAIVQNVGYPQPNFSHFRSTDIWLTGSDFNQVLATGWIGRYLDQEFPGYPVGYPTVQMPDPVAIQIGASVSLAFEGQQTNMGMAFSNPASFSNLVGNTSQSAPKTRAGHELAFARSIGQQLQTFATPVKAAADKGKTLSAQWPTAGQNSLADQLRIVSQLISGGLKTKIYVVNLGGFDSHTNLRDNQDPLLAKLSTSIAAFQDELKLQKLEDRVLGMTFSEFGRRVLENASMGTDHGAAAPMFFFGTKVIAGIHGNNPVLPDLATVDDNVNMDLDFRSVYASVLSQWFGASDSEITKTLLTTYPTFPIIQPASAVGSTAKAIGTELLQNYPNPCGGYGMPNQTHITFRTLGGPARLALYSTSGEIIATLLDQSVPAGEQIVTVNTRGLASGVYQYLLEADGIALAKELVVVK